LLRRAARGNSHATWVPQEATFYTERAAIGGARGAKTVAMTVVQQPGRTGGLSRFNAG
jgi:hypothetical protein